MNEETKRYEDAFEDVVNNIKDKRNKYYKEYDIVPPNKNRSLQLLHSLSPKDITNLRKVNKPTIQYDVFVAPLLVLMDKEPNRKVTPEGKLVLSYWTAA